MAISDATKQQIVEYVSLAVAAALGASVAQGVAGRLVKSQVARVALVAALSAGASVGGLWVADEINKALVKSAPLPPSKNAMMEVGLGAAVVSAAALLLVQRVGRLGPLSKAASVSLAAAAGAAGGLALGPRIAGSL